MTYAQRMRRVVLPQALRVIIPPTGNEFIAMMKDTALVASWAPIAWADPSGGRAARTGLFKSLEALVVAAMMYWVLTAIFTFFQRKLESRIGDGVRPPGRGAGSGSLGSSRPAGTVVR